MKPECISEQLLFNTVRLETGGNTCGTGFFFNFSAKNGFCPTIVTNKHVVNYNQDEETTFLVHLREDDGTTNESFKVTYKPHWLFHSKYDLCFCFAAPVFNAVKGSTGKDVFYLANDQSILGTDDKLGDLRALEAVTMVGYPIGLWDETNNLPIFRRGHTASHPAMDFNKSGIGLVDIACFPGSSGSPIYILDEGGYRDKHGTTHVGVSRIIFLGILYAGPTFTATGSLEVIDVPTQMAIASQTSVMINLGYYVRAKELLEFQRMVDIVIEQGL